MFQTTNHIYIYGFQPLSGMHIQVLSRYGTMSPDVPSEMIEMASFYNPK